MKSPIEWKDNSVTNWKSDSQWNTTVVDTVFTALYRKLFSQSF
jgi:hypothetical protein